MRKTVENLRKVDPSGVCSAVFADINTGRLGGEAVSVLRINISKLSEGTHHHSLQATPVEVGLDECFNKDVRIEATLEKTSRQLFLRANIKTGGRFTCDRCLEDFESEVMSEYSLVYVTDDRRVAGGSDEIQVISPAANHIDLGEDVRQFTVLALPQKMLCREDCAGLCPTCGTNLNRATCACQKEELDLDGRGCRSF